MLVVLNLQDFLLRDKVKSTNWFRFHVSCVESSGFLLREKLKSTNWFRFHVSCVESSGFSFKRYVK